MSQLLVTITMAFPAASLTGLEMFLRQLDQLDIKYSATMDSHPSSEALAQLPERLRDALASAKAN